MRRACPSTHPRVVLHLFFCSLSLLPVTSPNDVPSLLVGPATLTSSVTTSRTFNLQIRWQQQSSQGISNKTSAVFGPFLPSFFYHSLFCLPAACSCIVQPASFAAPAADHDDCRCSPLPYLGLVRLFQSSPVCQLTVHVPATSNHTATALFPANLSFRHLLCSTPAPPTTIQDSLSS